VGSFPTGLVTHFCFGQSRWTEHSGAKRKSEMYSPGRVEHDMALLADHWRERYVWERDMSMQAAALAQTRR